MNFNWAPISQDSVVHISAGEATALDPKNVAPIFSFNLGAADVYVTNICPHKGGVEFILHVNWATPLNIVVDISVLDAAEKVVVV